MFDWHLTWQDPVALALAVLGIIAAVALRRRLDESSPEPSGRLCPLRAGRPPRRREEIDVMTAQEIQRLLEAGLPGATVRVAGDDGQHFSAQIVSPAFAGKRRVQQHQMVYAALGDAMRERIHALALETCTPEEWARQHG